MKHLSNTNAQMTTSALGVGNVHSTDGVKEKYTSLKINSIAILQAKWAQNAHHIGNATEREIVILVIMFVRTCQLGEQKIPSMYLMRLLQVFDALAIQKTSITQFEIGIAMGRELAQSGAGAKEKHPIQRMQLTIAKNFISTNVTQVLS